MLIYQKSLIIMFSKLSFDPIAILIKLHSISKKTPQGFSRFITHACTLGNLIGFETLSMATSMNCLSKV